MRHDRIIRFPEAVKLTGLSRSTIHRLLNDGNFPQKIQLSLRAVGFRESDIMDFIATRTGEEGHHAR